jgi:hypothetical protein
MASTSLVFKDIFDGASNFLSWKERFTLELKEYDLWEFMDKVLVPPIDLTSLVAHEKKEIKSKRFILDSMKDHLILHQYENKYPRRCLMPR